MTRRCPYCGQSLPAEAIRFCVGCGHVIPQESDLEPTATRIAADGPPPEQSPHASGRHRSPSRGWIVAITALVVLAAGGSAAFAVLHSNRGRGVPGRITTPGRTHGQTPAGSATPAANSEQAELAQVTPLVQQSVPARSEVVKATQQVGACTMTPSDGVSLMTQAIGQRQAIMGSIDSLSVDAIPGGQEMIADLKQATQQSIAADQGFMGWIQDIQNAPACPIDTSQDSSYQAGLQASLQAMQAKEGFLAIWNPLASEFGQPTFTANEI